MKKIIFSLFSILLINISWSQTTNKKCKEESVEGNVKLVGCIDVEGKLHGYGTYTLSDGSLYAEGIWKRGKLNGKGVRTFSTEDQTQNYKGIFKNDQLYEGKIETTFNNGDISNEKYKDGKIIGTKYIFFNKSGKETNGEHYKSGGLKNGTERYRFADNSIMKSIYKNGEIIDQKKNTNNYYISEDILSDKESIKIPLEIEEGNNTMYLTLEIPTKNNPNYTARFVFDTGAESFKIGYRLFNELKEKGLKYRDLNVNIKTIGVSGIEMENNAIVIDKLKIGDFTLKNVVAHVSKLETSNISLIGIGFLNKFREVQWSLIAKELVFYK
jgi:hypothetical protein